MWSDGGGLLRWALLVVVLASVACGEGGEGVCGDAREVVAESMREVEAATEEFGGLSRESILSVATDVQRAVVVVEQNPDCFTVKERADYRILGEELGKARG